MNRIVYGVLAALIVAGLALAASRISGGGPAADPAVQLPASELGVAPDVGPEDGDAASAGGTEAGEDAAGGDVAAPAPDAAVGGSESPATGRPDTARPGAVAGGDRPAAERPTAGAPAPSRPGGPASESDAARQADATSILRAASAAYDGVRSMRADFVMELRNPLLRQTTTSRGTLFQRDPDRLLLRFSEPDGDVIVSDGSHLWVYYPSVNPQQVIRTAPGGGAGGLDLRSHFVGDPVQRFAAELEGRESVGGRDAHVLTLVPRQAGAGYSSMRVWIDAGDHLVRRFEIREENGSVRRFDLGGLRVNQQLADDLFRFTPPAGTRVVDR